MCAPSFELKSLCFSTPVDLLDLMVSGLTCLKPQFLHAEGALPVLLCSSCPSLLAHVVALVVQGDMGALHPQITQNACKPCEIASLRHSAERMILYKHKHTILHWWVAPFLGPLGTTPPGSWKKQDFECKGACSQPTNLIGTQPKSERKHL